MYSKHSHESQTTCYGPVMPRKQPRYGYRSVRQGHIGDALEALESRGLVSEWRLVFAHPPGRKQWEIDQGASKLAFWYITNAADGSRLRHQTREAEQFIRDLCSAEGLQWWAVPPPGGIAAARPVWKLLAMKAQEGHDVLGYAAIVENLRWEGVDVPPSPSS